MSVLVTGGAGYIGSHTLVDLIEQNYDVIVLDNLSNASAESLRRVEIITGKMPRFYKGDVEDAQMLRQIFQRHDIEAVIHFAGLKSVSESVADPLSYYHNNLLSTLVLCREMAKHQCFKLVFSSSATVYGTDAPSPVYESMPRSANSPYGRTKLMNEQILEDLQASDQRWSIVKLRYFNPVGAHVSGLIGEDPNGIPNNLMPYITQVAVGRLEQLSVFGNDYATVDGTGVRDYIHVCDLSAAHVKAVEFIAARPGIHTFNLGTGKGYSVLEAIQTFEKVSGKTIAYQIKPRREGDIGESYAAADLARLQLNWEAKYSFEQMLKDAWRWQSQNPQGYSDAKAIKPQSNLRKAS